MTTQQFNIMLEETLEKIKSILKSKATEYVQNDDRLHNFRQIAIADGIKVSEAVRRLRNKHLVSIKDMTLSQKSEYTRELIDEKTIDDINYGILLRTALLEENQCIELIMADNSLEYFIDKNIEITIANQPKTLKYGTGFCVIAHKLGVKHENGELRYYPRDKFEVSDNIGIAPGALPINESIPVVSYSYPENIGKIVISIHNDSLQGKVIRYPTQGSEKFVIEWVKIPNDYEICIGQQMQVSWKDYIIKE